MQEPGAPDKNNAVYDSQESLRTASDGQINFNEISPSDFNVLNQRYDEQFFNQYQQQLPP